jgi:hypothetical protein
MELGAQRKEMWLVRPLFERRKQVTQTYWLDYHRRQYLVNVRVPERQTTTLTAEVDAT